MSSAVMMVTELAASLIVCWYLAAELILVFSSESSDKAMESDTPWAKASDPVPRSSSPARQKAETLVMRQPASEGM